MKKQNNQDLKDELKELLESVGWDLRRLAQEMLDDPEINPMWDREEQTEYEKIKKRLSRKTTKVEHIYEYINFIIQRNPKLNFTKQVDFANLSSEANLFSEKEKENIEHIREIAKDFFKEQH